MKNQFQFQSKTITRNMDSNNLKLFEPNTNIIKMFYLYRETELFNELSNSIKLINNNQQFKIEIKILYALLFHY